MRCDIKRIVMVLVGICLSMPLFGRLAIRDVNVQQRWPWNGLVEITYKVDCDIVNVDKTPVDIHLTFQGYDEDRNQSIELKTLSGDGANGIIHAGGPYTLTWDVSKDYPTFNSSSFKIKVNAKTKAKSIESAKKGVEK